MTAGCDRGGKAGPARPEFSFTPLMEMHIAGVQSADNFRYPLFDFPQYVSAEPPLHGCVHHDATGTTDVAQIIDLNAGACHKLTTILPCRSKNKFS